MIKEAVEQFDNRVVSNKEIKDYIIEKYGEMNKTTINCQILICTVNAPSRIHYPENKRPRVTDSKYDFLYNVGRGLVEKYNPETHGLWEICSVDKNKLAVKRVDAVLHSDNYEDSDSAAIVTDSEYNEENKDFTFALESQLRDFIAENLSLIDNTLSLFVSDEGVAGVEYRIDVGIIDILAQNKNDEFVVIELKLSRGADAVLGQLQRYMGWIKKNLSENNAPVHGIIIAKSISDRLKYAVSVAQNISLFEYTMKFDISNSCCQGLFVQTDFLFYPVIINVRFISKIALLSHNKKTPMSILIFRCSWALSKFTLFNSLNYLFKEPQ